MNAFLFIILFFVLAAGPYFLMRHAKNKKKWNDLIHAKHDYKRALEDLTNNPNSSADRKIAIAAGRKYIEITRAYYTGGKAAMIYTYEAIDNDVNAICGTNITQTNID